MPTETRLSSIATQTDAPPRATARAFYRPELDVLRFAAFLLVFVRHTTNGASRVGAAISAAGQSGVCLFFLLSAYLITELMEREHARTGDLDLKAFYVRRVLRIWPLYFFALLLARLIDFHAPHLQMSNGRLLASVLLAGNWYAFFHGLPASFALVLWSISVEEQFYLLWPSIRKLLGRSALLAASILTLPVSALAILLLTVSHHRDQQLWINTFVQLQFFGVGGLLALWLKGRAPALPLPARALLAATGLCCFFLSEYRFHGPTLYPIPSIALAEYACMLAGAVLLFFAFLGFGGLRRARSLIWLGKVSYGLYVFHFLAYRLALRPHHLLVQKSIAPPWASLAILLSLTFSLTVAMAALSYRFLETPFLRLKDRFTVVRSRAI